MLNIFRFCLNHQSKGLSLFPGFRYTAGYKFSQRIYKFGGQPWFNDILMRHSFGGRKGKMMMQATAGSLTGIDEVILQKLYPRTEKMYCTNLIDQ